MNAKSWCCSLEMDGGDISVIFQTNRNESLKLSRHLAADSETVKLLRALLPYCDKDNKVVVNR